MPPPKVLEDSLLASSQLLVSVAAFGVSWLVAVSLRSLPPSPHSLLCVFSSCKDTNHCIRGHPTPL